MEECLTKVILTTISD